jgi:hypothetical protein
MKYVYIALQHDFTLNEMMPILVRGDENIAPLLARDEKGLLLVKSIVKDLNERSENKNNPIVIIKFKKDKRINF